MTRMAHEIDDGMLLGHSCRCGCGRFWHLYGQGKLLVNVSTFLLKQMIGIEHRRDIREHHVGNSSRTWLADSIFLREKGELPFFL